MRSTPTRIPSATQGNVAVNAALPDSQNEHSASPCDGIESGAEEDEAAPWTAAQDASASSAWPPAILDRSTTVEASTARRRRVKKILALRTLGCSTPRILAPQGAGVSEPATSPAKVARARRL